MSKVLFKEEYIIELRKNVYVKEASAKGITYTDEFKTLFIAEYIKGKLPSQIFKDCGFGVEMIGRERINSASKRWRKAYKQFGELGLSDTRKTNSGYPLNKELTLEKQLTKKDAEIAYLKSGVEL